MDAVYVTELREKGVISRREENVLLDLINRGIDEPVLAPDVPPSACRLWNAHHPDNNRLGARTADVHDIVQQQGRNKDPHRMIANSLKSQYRCASLNAYLGGWLETTREPLILEAVAWIWLDKSGGMSNVDDQNHHNGHPVNAQDAARNPSRLIRVLSDFKRQFSGHFRPSEVVDTLALKLEWWEVDSQSRHDALVYAHIDELMGEHEWVPVKSLVENDDLSLENIQASIDRMSSDLVRVGTEGVTFRHIWNSSERVATTLKRMIASPLSPIQSGAPSDTLTDEQSAVCQSVLNGNRVTLCCSPAGTGKTHTASALASHPAFRVPPPGDGTRALKKRRSATPNNMEESCGVLCTAPTHKALNVLRSKLSGDHVVFHTVQKLAVVPTPPRARLLIVDETSMLTMRHVHFLLTTYEGEETRILFIGDDVQLPCIGRGLPIRDLQTHIPTCRLTKCMRTNGAGLLDAAHNVRMNGTLIADGVEVIVHEHSTADEITETVSRLLMEAATNDGLDEQTRVIPPWDPSYVQVITPQKDQVKTINKTMQIALGTHGEDEEPFSGCYAGDAVRFSANTEQYKNGDEGVLERVDEVRNSRDQMTKVGQVRRLDGSTVSVESEYHLVPAYAGTVHKAQGSEYSTVILAVYPQTYRKMMNREFVYTSITRARARLHVVGYMPLLNNLSHVFRRTVFPFVTASNEEE